MKIEQKDIEKYLEIFESYKVILLFKVGKLKLEKNMVGQIYLKCGLKILDCRLADLNDAWEFTFRRNI